ncbi:MAG: hypothetical protein ABW352_16360 [Polyangiales bacterium]
MSRALVLILLLVTAGARAQEDLPQRGLALRIRLEEAAQRERHRGWMMPVLLVAGAGMITTGVLVPELAGIGLPFGSHAVLRATMTLAGTDDARKLPAKFDAIPSLPERVRFGEQRLARLARQHRRLRITDGVVSIALAASSVPLRFAFARHDDPGYRFGDSYIDYVSITLAALQATQGLLTLFDQTPAEAAWASYQQPPDERQRLWRMHTVLSTGWRF